MRLFTQEGKIVVLDIDQSLRMDNKKTDPTTLKKKYASLSEHPERIIRYMVNAKGKISRIDTAVDYEPSKGDVQTADENDKLVYYPDYNVTQRFRSGNNTFTGRVMLSKAVCFEIPHEINAGSEKYKAGLSTTILSNDTSYKPYVFDIDKDGYAGLVMIVGETVTGTENEYIVEKVMDGINEDNEPVNVLICWRNNEFYTMYLPSDVTVTKTSGNMLVPGDIVRLKTDSDNNITNVRVDFDYDKFAVSDTMSSGNFMATHSNPCFWAGVVYSVADSSVQISASKDEFGEYDFSQYSLRPVAINTANIIRFDCKSKTVRPIAGDEIKSYRSSGERAEYIFLRSSYDSPNFAVVFDNYNAE